MKKNYTVTITETSTYEVQCYGTNEADALTTAEAMHLDGDSAFTGVTNRDAEAVENA